MILASVMVAVDTAIDLAHDHPDVAKKLWDEVKQILGDKPDEHFPHPEAVRAQVSGIAAAKASAVTSARMRDQKASQR